MSQTSLVSERRILFFSSVVEIVTGLGLALLPRVVAALLLGSDLSGAGVPVGRVAGIALLALGVACWPGGERTESGSGAFRAMVVYNTLVALYLCYHGAVGHGTGVLLWPAVVLHAVLALLLVRNKLVAR